MKQRIGLKQAWLVFWFVAIPLAAPAAHSATNTFDNVKRILFLGDSITYGGQFVEFFETFLRIRHPDRSWDILNLGLPSETVSGLSEPGHAGGAFPRPDLHERLDRVLAKTKPDLVIACYGMNDGIYYPYSEDRARRYQEGIMRMRTKVQAAGARIIHLTPPVFDAVPLKGRTLPAGREEYRQPYESYNEVLDRYSDWLLSQRTNGWTVLDVHGPLNRLLAERRRSDPGFRLAGDGVHPGTEGHWLMAQPLMLYCGAQSESVSNLQTLLNAYPAGSNVLRLVQQRQRVLKDAWLTETGHQRPGMGKGLPVGEAQSKVADIEQQLRAVSAPVPGRSKP